MKEFEGTKGKWKHYKNQDTWIVSDAEGVGVLVQAKSSLSSPYHAESNAKLASCAPDLLDNLKELFNLLEEHQPNWYLRSHYNKIKRNLEKAV